MYLPQKYKYITLLSVLFLISQSSRRKDQFAIVYFSLQDFN